jgi:hypothetical protein
MPKGPLLLVGIVYSVTAPPTVIFPILFASCSVNQSLLSGPVVMPRGPLLLVLTGNSLMVTVPCACARVIERDNGIAMAAAIMMNAARDKTSFDLSKPFMKSSPFVETCTTNTTKTPEKSPPPGRSNN